MIGSSLLSRASAVRSRPNWFRAGVSTFPSRSGCDTDGVPPRSFSVSSRTFFRSTPSSSRHARRDALTLSNQPEEQMLGSDVVVAQLPRLVHR